jgi:hypothetical protein
MDLKKPDLMINYISVNTYFIYPFMKTQNMLKLKIFYFKIIDLHTLLMLKLNICLHNKRQKKYHIV